MLASTKLSNKTKRRAALRFSGRINRGDTEFSTRYRRRRHFASLTRLSRRLPVSTLFLVNRAASGSSLVRSYLFFFFAQESFGQGLLSQLFVLNIPIASSSCQNFCAAKRVKQNCNFPKCTSVAPPTILPLLAPSSHLRGAV